MWAAKGAYVFRVSTPDEADMLPRLEEGHAIVAHLLDGTVPQITIVNGLIGHDHPGAWNWDGLWPYWNRVTFRAGSFEKLAAFMARAKKNSNVHTGFHLNLTDVNIGLRDYPESREFFQKLVETKSIYRRDWNKATNRREGEPFVPVEIEKYADDTGQSRSGADLRAGELQAVLGQRPGEADDRRVLRASALCSARALPRCAQREREAISRRCSPDGPLGGSEETQVEGMQAIADYLRSKGTDLGTEGDRRFLGNERRGVSPCRLRLAARQRFFRGRLQRDLGRFSAAGLATRLWQPGAFNVSPVASTVAGLDRVRAHYAALLAGQPGTKAVADLKTWRIAMRDNRVKDEFDIPGTGDPFRGDWVDLVNNFYLIGIQELYHIGNGSVRRRIDSIGHVHLGSYTVSGSNGTATVSVPDFAEPDWVRPAAQKIGRLMIESPTTTRVTVPRSGRYSLKVTCFLGGRSDNPQLGVYVNGQHYRSFDHIPIPEAGRGSHELDAGEIELREGENTIAFDSGPIRATWSDGTTAEWSTPSLPQRLQGLERRRGVRRGLRPHVARHVERPAEDLFLQLGRHQPQLETARRLERCTSRDVVSVDAGGSRQGHAHRDQRPHDRAVATATGSLHPRP